MTPPVGPTSKIIVLIRRHFFKDNTESPSGCHLYFTDFKSRRHHYDYLPDHSYGKCMDLHMHGFDGYELLP